LGYLDLIEFIMLLK